jgi:hypothetical protein
MSQQFRSVFRDTIGVVASRKKLGEICIVAEESDTGTLKFWLEEVPWPTNTF